MGDRINRLNTRVAGGQNTNYEPRNRDNTTGSRDTSTTGRRTNTREIPAGTEVDVRLQSRLDSKEAMVEDRVEATTLVDLYQGVVTGVVSDEGRFATHGHTLLLRVTP